MRNIKITRTIIESTLGALYRINKKNKSMSDTELEKYKSYYFLLCKWLLIREHGLSIEMMLLKDNKTRIAIYGFRELGEALYDELKESKISVEFIIDRNPSYIISTVDIYRPEENYPDVDAIIVTPIYDYYSIKEQMSRRTSIPIISLGEIVEKLYVKI